MDVNINDVVVSGMRRLKIWQEIKEVIPSNGSVFKRKDGIEVNFKELTQLEEDILELLEIPSSVYEIMCATRECEFDVSFAIYELYKKGYIEVFDRKIGSKLLYEKKKRDIKRKIREHIEKLEFERAREQLFELMHFIIKGDEYESIKGSIDDLELKHLKTKFDYNTILRPKIKLEEVKNRNLTQLEAFVLSRLNGGMDIRSLLKLVPMREVELLRVLESLREKGAI